MERTSLLSGATIVVVGLPPTTLPLIQENPLVVLVVVLVVVVQEERQPNTNGIQMLQPTQIWLKLTLVMSLASSLILHFGLLQSQLIHALLSPLHLLLLHLNSFFGLASPSLAFFPPSSTWLRTLPFSRICLSKLDP